MRGKGVRFIFVAKRGEIKPDTFSTVNMLAAEPYLNELRSNSEFQAMISRTH
jgi:hypothetical protein